MNIETLENILKVGETTCIEFKRAGDGAKNDTFETVCSFLNRLGGDILLGVTDNGEVIGIPENSVEQIIRNIINVTNDGLPISKESQEEIFVPFYTTKQEGTGIGLSLSRQIMRLHNGSLMLTRSDESSTVFTLVFR